MSVIRAVVIAVLIASLPLGCSDPSSFSVFVSFPDQAALDEAAHLRIYAIGPAQPSVCGDLVSGNARPGDVGYTVEDSIEFDLPPAGGDRTLDAVGPGRRLFYAEAEDSAGVVILKGCTEATAGGGGIQEVAIELVRVEDGCETDGDCDDDLWCTGIERCEQGSCEVDPPDCDDGDPCTQDQCDEEADACDNPPVVNPGQEGPPGDTSCSDGLDNDCDGLTDGADPTCVACGQDSDCDDQNECTSNVCDAGLCVFEPLMPGTVCSDGLFCTEGDACDATANCGGQPMDCTGLDSQCSLGVCDEDADVCVAQTANEGQACDDGLFCTENESCQSGSCTGGAPRDCEDGDPCTQGTCGEAADQCGQQVVPLPGAEGLTQGTTCSDGQDNDCDGRVDNADPDCLPCAINPDCDDGYACTVNTCVAGACTTAFVADGTGCDDTMFCTTGDSCNVGVCSGTARDCTSLSDDCNLGACNEAADACQAQAINEGQICDDALYCTVGDTCQAGSCAPLGPRDCSALDSTCALGACDETADECAPLPISEGSDCEDGLYCTTGETCQLGSCTGGSPNDCSSVAGPCIDATCDEALRTCTTSFKPEFSGCDDGLYCTGLETCDAVGNCNSSGNPCPDEGTPCNSCNEDDDSCFDRPGTVCGDDGFDCTLEQCDGVGGCITDGLDHVQCQQIGFELCDPTCSPDATGCRPLVQGLTLDCNTPAQLPDSSQCQLDLAGGTDGLADCLTCSARIGMATIDFADFGDSAGGCEQDGWIPSPGPCYNSVDNCQEQGTQACCDQFSDICDNGANFGQPVLQSDRDWNCGGQREWRIEKGFDFTNVRSPTLCLDVAHWGISDRSGVIVYASGAAYPLEQIYCNVGQLWMDPPDRFETVCINLPAWVDDNPSVTLTISAHAHNSGERLFVDNVAVKGPHPDCPAVQIDASYDDFQGCNSGSWNIGGPIDCGNLNCFNHPEWFQAFHNSPFGGGSFWLENQVDISALEDDVTVCFQYGHENMDPGRGFIQVIADYGSGWTLIWEKFGGFEADGVCSEVCVNLSELDPQVNDNSLLFLRIEVEPEGFVGPGMLGIFGVFVSGIQYCDDDGSVINLSAPVWLGGGSYQVDATDVSGIPVDTEIRCQWDPDATSVFDVAWVDFVQP